MNRWRVAARRGGVALLLLLLFWSASQFASRVPWAASLGTSVHTLGLGDYSADAMPAMAPLTLQIVDEVSADVGTTPSPSVSHSPTPTPTPTHSPTPGPTPTPLPTPTPTPTPIPTPTPLPTPTPIPTGGITGRVTDGTSPTGIPGALVQTLTFATTTNSTGGYSLSLAPGSYSVTASASGFLPKAQSVTVPLGGWVTVNFALSRSLAVIKGTVVNNLLGTAIAGATVSLSPGGWSAKTSPTGTFAFPDLSPGTYTVTASAPGYRSTSEILSVSGGETLNIVIRLSTLLGP